MGPDEAGSAGDHSTHGKSLVMMVACQNYGRIDSLEASAQLGSLRHAGITAWVTSRFRLGDGALGGAAACDDQPDGNQLPAGNRAGRVGGREVVTANDVDVRVLSRCR